MMMYKRVQWTAIHLSRQHHSLFERTSTTDKQAAVRVFTISNQLVKQLTKMSSRTHFSNKHTEQNQRVWKKDRLHFPHTLQPCLKLTRKQQTELCGYMFHSPCLYTATKTGKWIPPLVDVAFIPSYLNADMSPIIFFSHTHTHPTPHPFFSSFFFFTATLSSTVFRLEFRVGLLLHVIIDTWFDVTFVCLFLFLLSLM